MFGGTLDFDMDERRKERKQRKKGGQEGAVNLGEPLKLSSRKSPRTKKNSFIDEAEDDVENQPPQQSTDGQQVKKCGSFISPFLNKKKVTKSEEVVSITPPPAESSDDSLTISPEKEKNTEDVGPKETDVNVTRPSSSRAFVAPKKKVTGVTFDWGHYLEEITNFMLIEECPCTQVDFNWVFNELSKKKRVVFKNEACHAKKHAIYRQKNKFFEFMYEHETVESPTEINVKGSCFSKAQMFEKIKLIKAADLEAKGKPPQKVKQFTSSPAGAIAGEQYVGSMKVPKKKKDYKGFIDREFAIKSLEEAEETSDPDNDNLSEKSDENPPSDVSGFVDSAQARYLKVALGGERKKGPAKNNEPQTQNDMFAAYSETKAMEREEKENRHQDLLRFETAKLEVLKQTFTPKEPSSQFITIQKCGSNDDLDMIVDLNETIETVKSEVADFLDCHFKVDDLAICYKGNHKKSIVKNVKFLKTDEKVTVRIEVIGVKTLIIFCTCAEMPGDKS